MIVLALVGLLAGVVLSHDPLCSEQYKIWGLSNNFNETVAHAIHSLTLNELRKFEPTARKDNFVPVVNLRLNDPQETERVKQHAPEETLGSDFGGEAMNTIDMILSQIGQPTDGLGPNWSPLERVVHKFHMKDLWSKLKGVYNRAKEVIDDGDVSELCSCLKDTKSNGIFDAVDWVAQHYKTGTPITLLNRPIPKLTDASSWSVWRSRLLHYYSGESLYDASLYLYCALNA